MTNTDILNHLLALYPFLVPIFCWASIVIAIAGAIDARFPQPAPGSNWLPVRKVISILALNVGNAANAGQPPLLTWFIRMLVLSVQAAPKGSAAAAIGLTAEQILSLVQQAESQALPAPTPAAPNGPAPKGTTI